MTVVGFNLTKITAERKDSPKGGLKIDNNANIKDIKEKDIGIGKGKQKTMEIDFVFKSTYKPKFAEIVLEGKMLMLEKDKAVKEITKEWKKNKKLPKNYVEYVMNSILGRCSIEVILLSREINLPAPFPLPRIKQKQEAKEYMG